MTDFGIELLKKFGELNRPVSYIELLRIYTNEVALQNGIAELQSEELIRETAIMTYCITQPGRRRFKSLELRPAEYPIIHPNKPARKPKRNIITMLWKFISENALMSGIISGIIILLLTIYCHSKGYI